MYRLTPFAMLILGIAIASIAAGVAPIFISSAWIMLPIVTASAVGTTVLMIRQWQRGPLQGRLQSSDRKKTRIEKAFEFGISIIILVAFILMITFSVATLPPICLCLTTRNVLWWFFQIAGGGLFTFLLVAGFVAVYMSFRQLTAREINDSLAH